MLWGVVKQNLSEKPPYLHPESELIGQAMSFVIPGIYGALSGVILVAQFSEANS